MDKNRVMGNTLEQERRNWRIVRNRCCIRAGLIFLGVLGMQILGVIVLGIVLGLQAFLQSDNYAGMLQRLAGAYDNVGQYTILLSVFCAVASGIWCGILYYRSDWRVRPFDYRKALSGRMLLLAAVTVSGTCVFVSVLLGMLQQLLPGFFDNYNQLMEIVSGGDYFLSIAYVVVIGPISEELIFRGALFDRFYLAFSFWTANFLQALLFGIYHMNFIQGVYAFVLGMLLGMIRQMTGSILTSVFSHMVFNGTSYVITFVAGLAGKYENIVLLGMFLASIAAVFWGVRKIWENCTKNIENQT